MRWIVEIPRDDAIEDVMADLVEIAPSGVLAFTDRDANVVAAYAPGAWVRVTRYEDSQ